jgi:hypothetical protein
VGGEDGAAGGDQVEDEGDEHVTRIVV